MLVFLLLLVHAAIPGAEIRRAPLPLQVLFDGRNELDQISRIFSLLGSPNEKIWPGLSKLPAASKVGCPDCAAATKPAASLGDGVGVPHGGSHGGCVRGMADSLGQLLCNTSCLLTCPYPASMLKCPSLSGSLKSAPRSPGCRPGSRSSRTTCCAPGSSAENPS